MANKYDDSSISQLKGADRVRKRPEVMLGTGNIAGTRHTVFEIIGNALDEASAGYGNKLVLKYYGDTSISVRDYGRGVPLGWNVKEQNWNWHLIYNELYAGGKYDDQQKALQEVDWSTMTVEKLLSEFNYIFSVGLNGLGGASVQYTSEYFEVRSYRDGKCSKMCFSHGNPVLSENPTQVEALVKVGEDENKEPIYETQLIDQYLEITDTDEPDGTFVRWLPDKEVFAFTDVGGDWLYNTCVDMLHVAGLDLSFENEQTEFSASVDSGGVMKVLLQKFGKNISIKDADDNPVIFECDKFAHGTTQQNAKEAVYVCVSKALFTFVSKGAKNICFHNSVPTSGGSQHRGIDSAVDSFFKSVITDIKLEQSDYMDRVGVVLTSYSNIVSYKGQTKDETDNYFIQDTCRDMILEKLKLEFGKGNKQLLAVIDEVRKEAEARIAIREYAKVVRQVKKNGKEKPPEKFVSCVAYDNRDASSAELWITEGDSAKTSCAGARDKLFQALLPVRGKVLNVLKAPIDKILKNEIIRGLFNVLECGMDIGEGLFDIDKTRFHKIIFATDADEDGYQIRVLLFLIFYRLAPELLRKGYVYVAETPLYSATLPNGKQVYIKNNTELAELEKEWGTFQRNRFKGLGECDANVLRETTMTPANRTLVPLTMDVNDRLSQQVIDVLFGADKGKQRKPVLTNVLGADVGDLIDANLDKIRAIEDSDMEDGVEYVTINH